MNQEIEQMEVAQSTITPEQLREERKKAEAAISIYDAVKRLEKNSDFQMVFLNHYFQEYPKHLVSFLAEPNFNLMGDKATQREEILECMIGVARLESFIRNLRNMAMEAEKKLEDLRERERTSS